MIRLSFIAGIVVAVVALTALCLPVILNVMGEWGGSLPNAGSGALPAGNPGGVPLSIGMTRRALLTITPSQRSRLVDRVCPPAGRKVAVSFFLHVLRLHGLNGRFDYPGLYGGRDILRLLIDERYGQSYFGAPAVTKTRHGIEFVGSNISSKSNHINSESHRDQCLASLAELGVPLSTTVHADGQELTIEAALTDSLANFHLKQKELQWTAIAYALYLPPRKAWVNKFGERFTLDNLVDELLAAPFEESSCAGTHLGYALTLLYRADGKHDELLSPSVRDRLRKRLERTVTAALSMQSEDGSWPIDWAREIQPASERVPSADVEAAEGRLLVTGHLAEWMLYLPPEFAVPDERLQRAAHWLLARLEAFKSDLIDDDIVCPYTHAACAVMALSRASAPTESAQFARPN